MFQSNLIIKFKRIAKIGLDAGITRVPIKKALHSLLLTKTSAPGAMNHAHRNTARIAR